MQLYQVFYRYGILRGKCVYCHYTLPICTCRFHQHLHVNVHSLQKRAIESFQVVGTQVRLIMKRDFLRNFEMRRKERIRLGCWMWELRPGSRSSPKPRFLKRKKILIIV